MEHQTANHFALPVAPSSVNDNINVIALSLVSNMLLAGLNLAERRASTSTSFTTDEMHSINNMLSDVITLLAMLLTKCLHRNDIHCYKAAVLKDVACLFVATSRIGLGLHMVCEHLAAIEFQQSRDSPQIVGAWIAIFTFYAKELLCRRTPRVAKASESALLTSTLMWYRVDGVISLMTLASSLGKDIAWLVFTDGLAKVLLLLQSGIIGLVSACASLHDNISKLRIDE